MGYILNQTIWNQENNQKPRSDSVPKALMNESHDRIKYDNLLVLVTKGREVNIYYYYYYYNIIHIKILTFHSYRYIQS